MQKTLNIMIMIGIVMVAALNPLSIQVGADALTILVEQAKVLLVDISTYTVVMGGTLILVGVILSYILHSQEADRKESKRLKNLAKQKTSIAGKFLEA